LWRRVAVCVVRNQRFRSPFSSPWRWSRHGPLKRWYPTTTLHSISTHRTWTWNIRTVKFSQLTITSSVDFEPAPPQTQGQIINHHGHWSVGNIVCLLIWVTVSYKLLQTLDSGEEQIRKTSPMKLIDTHPLTYEGVSKSFRTGRLERELQMVQLSATRCSCIAILWVSLVSFAAITLCVASRGFIAIVVYFVTTQSGNFWIYPRM
jgi:hypothetical protein